MDKDERELIGRLFARATFVLEDAHEASVRGQSHKISPAKCRAEARLLRDAVHDAAVFAEAAAIIARRSERKRND